MINLIILLFAVVSAILFAITIGLVVRQRYKNKSHNECTGIIVDFLYSSDYMIGDPRRDKFTISPVVSFSVDGEEYKFIGSYCTRSMKAGQQVPVLYNKKDPTIASLKPGLHVAPIITGVLAFGLILPVVVFVVLRHEGIIGLNVF